MTRPGPAPGENVTSGAVWADGAGGPGQGGFFGAVSWGDVTGLVGWVGVGGWNFMTGGGAWGDMAELAI